MKLNLYFDRNGQNMERALRRAYRLGYEDAAKLRKRGSKVRPLRTGEQIAKELCSQCREEHIPYLRSAYGAGLFQCERG